MDDDIFAGQVNNALAQAVQRGTSALNSVPLLIKAVIKEGRWRGFTGERSGRRVSFATFAEFASAPLPDGLETSLEILRCLCALDPEPLKLLDDTWEGS
jgi:hypothetical protein